MDAGVVISGQPEWASPFVLIPKKNDVCLIWMDYRHLHAASIPDAYLLACMHDYIYSLGQTELFTVLDALRKIGMCQSKIETKRQLNLPLKWVLFVPLLRHLAYKLRFLRFKVYWTSSFLKLDEKRVLLGKMTFSSFLKIITNTSRTSLKRCKYSTWLK